MWHSALRTKLQESIGQRFGIDLTIREKAPAELLPTGIPNIDVPRGTLTEIYGASSSGRTSLLHGALARATQRPEFCALIDASNSFDPQSAASAGIQLSHLLWICCSGNTENALKATDLVIQAGGFGIVALDLAGVPARDARRISLASWFRLRNAVEQTPTALVLIEEERNAGSCSMLQIQNRSSGFEITGDLLQALTVYADIGPRGRARSAFKLKPLYYR